MLQITNHKFKLLVILALLLGPISGATSIYAEPTNLDLTIQGIECTVDEIYSGEVPDYITNPEDCAPDPEPEPQPEENKPIPSLPLSRTGQQAVLLLLISLALIVTSLSLIARKKNNSKLKRSKTKR